MTNEAREKPILTPDYLAYVVRQVRLDGEYRPKTWLSAVQEYEAAWHTSPSEEDTDTAYEIIAYFQEQTPDDALTPHLADLISLMRRPEVRRDELALAASAVFVYQRAREREARAQQEKARRGTSRHVGARGDEIEIPHAYVLAHRDRPSAHTGRVHIYDLQDATGNAYTWFAPRRELEPGWTYDLTASVKRHEEYREIKKTIVGNVRVARVVEEGSK
jgi:hypothetical protein